MSPAPMAPPPSKPQAKKAARRLDALMDQLDELEESGRVHCIRPNDPITIGRFEGDENKLLDLYNRGHREGREKLEELRTYLEK